MSGRNERSKTSAAVNTLRGALGNIGDVLPPEKAEEPILAQGCRGALFEWLAEMRAAEELRGVGLEPRSTALLHGPPGCGKTTLAHHLAARLGVPMVLIGSENLFRSYLGESEQQMAKLFDGLERADTPCVVFLDEIEAVGGKRDKNKGGGADNARTSMLTVLLRRIERFRGMLLAATNRPDDLDPALWRRFHLQLAVDLPGGDERFAILSRYLAPFTLPEADMDVLTDLTEGASPALLRGLMEGVKRALVLWPRMNRSAGEAVPIFRTIVAGIRPPPEMQIPLLWASPDAVDLLSSLSWPPTRPVT